MHWRDEGVVLSARPHGETSSILNVLTVEHGRHAGIVRGGSSRKIAPVLQPGAQLDLTWTARLADHIGTFQVEPVRSRAALVMSNRRALSGLNAVTSLLVHFLPEREPQPALFHQTTQLLDLLGQNEIWPLAYLRWEMALLDTLGFGLDLSACAVTGATEDLSYISPKSGRAVSQQGAGDWADRLLALPPVMLNLGDANDAEVITALETTGYFFAHHVAAQTRTGEMPEARARFVERFRKEASEG